MIKNETSNNVDTAIILAGGLGTRLRSIISDVPKPMAPINNKPFLEHLCNYWLTQGIKTFILAVGYKSEIIIDYFKKQKTVYSLNYSIETEQLGTGGSLLLALNQFKLKKDFLLLNGDSFFPINLAAFHKFHTKQKSLLSLSLFQSSETKRFMSVHRNLDFKIISVNNQSSEQKFLANGGAYIISPEIKDYMLKIKCKNFSLENKFIPKFITNQGNIYGKEFNLNFIDIGLPKDYKIANRDLFKGKLK